MRIVRYFYLLALGIVALPAHAQVSLGFPTAFADFSSQDLQTTIENIVRLIVGFLGIITVLIIIYGGFLWFSSFGNEEKIEQAKKVIGAGVVGLVLVLAAYAIASFVVRSLETAV